MCLAIGMLEDINITIPQSAVRKRLGYQENTIYTPQVEELISDLINCAHALIKPRGNYVILKEIQIEENKVTLGEHLHFQSQNIADLLKDKQQVALLAVTIGKRLEEKVGNLFEGEELTKATVLDAIGSIAVEETANEVTRVIRQEAVEKGLPDLTMRYSPGYGDLSLSIQPQLLEVVEGEALGITITPSNFLLPQKSITALHGLGE